MRKCATLFILIIIYCLNAATLQAGEPFCHIRHFDETSGLSEREVRRIVQDKNGVIWMATWSGLCRYDGYRFDRLRPGINDEARKFSNRVGDIKLNAAGNLWCRVDDNLLLFDVTTYRFSDIGSRLNEKLGRDITVRQIFTSDPAGQTIIRTHSEEYLVFNDSDPVGTMKLYKSKPNIPTLTPNNRQLGAVPPYSDKELIYSTIDRNGGTQLITRDGKILYRKADESSFRLLGDLDNPGKLLFGITDTSGNIWLRSEEGAYCLKIGVSNYDFLPSSLNSLAKTIARDKFGRLYVGYNEQEAFAIYNSATSLPRYINAAGSLSNTFVPFDAHIYSMLPLDDGRILVGCKPEGLMLLTPRADAGYNIITFSNSGGRQLAPAHEAVYDLKFDSRGQIWVATLGGGIDIMQNPLSAQPTFIHLADMPGYPKRAKKVRRVIPVNDTLTLAATTGGLLAIKISRDGNKIKYGFKLHGTEPGRENSLGNIATMDLLTTSDGRLLIATETDGVNWLKSPFATLNSDDAEFGHINEMAGAPSDAILSVMQIPGTQNALATTPYGIFSLQPDRSVKVLTSFQRQDNIRLSEATPIHLGNDLWLMGTNRGAMSIAPNQLAERSIPTSVILTSAQIGAHPDSLLSATTDTVYLSPSERNLTLNFAATDYQNPENLLYMYSFDNSDWRHLGHTHSLTFAKLAPGTHILRIRSTNGTGTWMNNDREITIIVSPKFRETIFAKILILLLLLVFAGVVFYTLRYIRSIKSKQRETLEAYLQIMNAQSAPVKPAPKQAHVTSDADDAFMKRVLTFVEQHLSDPNADVDMMAAFTATSRSGLNRKLKSLVGMTPLELIRESRMRRASELLASTSLPIKEIAAECGFADINYFGKSFKSTMNMTPTAYRRQHQEGSGE